MEQVQVALCSPRGENQPAERLNPLDGSLSRMTFFLNQERINKIRFRQAAYFDLG
ncbi:MAG: hypothetical protein ACK2TV_14500 [Anaerolineales bacterium]